LFLQRRITVDKLQAAFGALMGYEQATESIDKKALRKAIDASLQSPPLTFVIFSCLTTERDGEELAPDFFRTSFFAGSMGKLSSKPKQAVRLAQKIGDLGLEVQMLLLLSDTEPRRTWGWNVPQDELTLTCELMCEQGTGSGLLQNGWNTSWHPTPWSDVEALYKGGHTFDEILALTRESGKHRLLVDQQERHLRGFADSYHFPLGLRETAVRQVAAYAFEGEVLENVLPRSILLQSECPWKEKDPLYQWRRKSPLPIIHPFPR
jgi:hypothetical protein